jgi:hypothetical protein
MRVLATLKLRVHDLEVEGNTQNDSRREEIMEQEEE